jgi:lysozyme
MNTPTISIVVSNEDLRTSRSGLEMIEKLEGFYPTPYKDAGGRRTIGIGHLIRPGEDFPDGSSITHEQAYSMLSSELLSIEAVIKRNVRVELNQNQFDALVSFGYNCGPSVFTRGEVIWAINSGDLCSVPEKILKWSKVKVNGRRRVVAGLYRRRLREGELFVRPPPVTWSVKEFLTSSRGALALREVRSLLGGLGVYPGALGGLCRSSNRNIFHFKKVKGS